MLVDILLLSLPPLFSAVVLAAQHWFPWHSGVRPLSRLQAYVAGTSVVVGVPVVAMLIAHVGGIERPVLFWALLLVLNTVAGGLTVMAAYWIDSKRAVGLEEVHAAGRREHRMD